MKICKADVRITDLKNIGPWLPIIETNKFIGPIIGLKKLENMIGKRIRLHQIYSKGWPMVLKILLWPLPSNHFCYSRRCSHIHNVLLSLLLGK